MGGRSVDTVMSALTELETAEAEFCTWYPASPPGKRKSLQDSAEPQTKKEAVAAPLVNAPSAAKSEVCPPPEEMAECLDKILTLAFEQDRRIKEAEKDAMLPGDAGRCAVLSGRRARRKSQELQKDFHELMGDRLEAVFRAFDEDGNGTLEPHELKKALAAAGRPSDDDTVSKSIAAMDKDGDGLISLEEFKAIAWTCATN